MTVINVVPKNEEKLMVKRHLLKILGTMKFILFIAKIAGIFNFSSNKTTYKLETSDKKKSLAFAATYLLAYFVAFLVAFQTAGKRKHQFDETFYAFVRYAYNVFFCTSTLMQVIMGFCVKFSVAKWFNSLAASDAAMERIGLVMDFKSLQKSFTLRSLLVALMFNAKMILFLMAFQKPWIVSLCVALYHFLKNIFKSILLSCIAHLQLRFEKINSAIDNLKVDGMDTLSISSISNNLNKDTPSKLDRICRFHFRLCYLSKKLNGIASFQFFYSFAVSLGALLFFCYFLYHRFREIYVNPSGYSFNSIVVILFGIVALIDEMIDCLVITKSCELLCYVANETPKHLHELRNKIQNREWDQQIKTNSLQFLHQKVSFTALGYFDINSSMLTYVTGTVITYLVLFIQYDQTFLDQNKTIKEITATGFTAKI